MSTRHSSETSSTGRETPGHKLSDVLTVGRQRMESLEIHGAPINVRGERLTERRAKAFKLYGNRSPGEDNPHFFDMRMRREDNHPPVDPKEYKMYYDKEIEMVHQIFACSVTGVESLLAAGFKQKPYPPYNTSLMGEEGWVYFILSKTKRGGLDVRGKGPVLDVILQTHPRVADEFDPGPYPDCILPMVKLFIDHGERVNRQTADFGDTVLHCAARHDFTGELTTLLLNAGANVSLVNYQNQRAQDVARVLGNKIVERLLGEHNAQELYKTLRRELREHQKRGNALYWQELVAKKKYHPDQMDWETNYAEAHSPSL